MRKVFVEYFIVHEFVDDYKLWLQNKLAVYPETEVLESCEQPGLFVEIWTNLPLFQDWSRLRRDEHNPEWGALASWVRGGKDKINIWEFSKI